jgi:hypothetical protein
LGVGLTTPHHKKTAVTEPQRRGQGPIWAAGPLDGWMDHDYVLLLLLFIYCNWVCTRWQWSLHYTITTTKTYNINININILPFIL